MSIIRHPKFLQTILIIDAAACVAIALLMVAGADEIATLTQFPASLLLYAGLSLFPIGAYIAFVATRKTLSRAGVWLVMLGNFGWVAGSIALLAGGLISPNALGYVFVAFQAVAVALLADLEYVGLRATVVR